MTRGGGPLRGVGDLVSRIAEGTVARLIQSETRIGEAGKLLGTIVTLLVAAQIPPVAIRVVVMVPLAGLFLWAVVVTARREIRRAQAQRGVDGLIDSTERPGGARPGRARGSVDQLDDDQAMALFQSLAGPATVGEDDARELLDACGRQPKAIRSLARAIGGHLFEVAHLLNELRVTVLSPTHRPVADFWGPAFLARFDTAYTTKLDAPSRRLYRLLALVPEGPARADPVVPERSTRRLTLTRAPCAPAPLDREALAALSGWREADAFKAIETLVGVGLVEEAGAGRYQIKREHVPLARIHLRVDEPQWSQTRALVRLARHLALEAERRAVQPGRQGGVWFAQHHDVLAGMVMAATAGRADAAPLPAPVRRSWFRLAVALCRWYAAESRLSDWRRACTAVRDAPLPPRWLPHPLTNELGLVRGRPRVAGWVHNELGAILHQDGDTDEATREFRAALEAHGTRGRAQVELNLALVRMAATGDASEVLWALRRAGRHRSPRDKLGVALTELALGAAQYELDGLDEARRHLQSAVDIFDAQREWRGKAAALVDLAMVEAKLGRRRAAIDIGRAALETYDRVETETAPAEKQRAERLVRRLGLADG